MNGDDLSDVGLEALEKLEAQDQEESQQDAEDTSKDGGEDETTEKEETSNPEEEQTEDSEEESEDDDSEEDTEEDKDDKDEKEEDDKDEEEEDKELSDEEFEKLAKKRGYAKKEEQDAKLEEIKKARQEAIQNIPKPKEVDEETWNSLPPMNKYIYNSLPYITAQGKDGNDIRVKTPAQLPDDFEFKNEKAKMQFINDLNAQEAKAQQMVTDIRTRAQATRENTARVAEARQVVGEIETLQKSGDLPKPKAKPNTPEFDSDPAVKLINEVLAYRTQRNREGANLSVTDAYTIYKAQHPKAFSNEAKGDKERRKVAKRVAGNSKSSDTGENKDDDKNKPQYYKAGMSTEDVLDRVLDDMEGE